MFQILTELLGYVRKLLPLMELYMARRPAQPVRDPASEEFQRYIAEALRANRESLIELRSAVETVNQRLKVLDDQASSYQRDLSRMADQQRAIMIAVIVSALASVGALIAAIVAVARH